MPFAMERPCKPNFVTVKDGGNHSSSPDVTAGIERPTRKRPRLASDLSGQLKRVSLFGLAPRGVYLAAPVTRHAGELLPHRFTLDPSNLKFEISNRWAGLFSVALVVTRPGPGARTLSGSLPYGVRTFLFPDVSEKRLPGLLHCEAETV